MRTALIAPSRLRTEYPPVPPLPLPTVMVRVPAEWANAVFDAGVTVSKKPALTPSLQAVAYSPAQLLM